METTVFLGCGWSITDGVGGRWPIPERHGDHRRVLSRGGTRGPRPPPPSPWEAPGPGSRLPLSPPASDILNYYFLCNQAVSNPFQQVRAAGKVPPPPVGEGGAAAGTAGSGRGCRCHGPRLWSRGRRVGRERRLPRLPQRLTLTQRALANIHSQLQGLEREAGVQSSSAQVSRPAVKAWTGPARRAGPAGRGGARGLWAGPWGRPGLSSWRDNHPPQLAFKEPLLSLEETLNVTEGNFHQLVALLNCRGLHKVILVPCQNSSRGASGPFSPPTSSLSPTALENPTLSSLITNLFSPVTCVSVRRRYSSSAPCILPAIPDPSVPSSSLPLPPRGYDLSKSLTSRGLSLLTYKTGITRINPEISPEPSSPGQGWAGPGGRGPRVLQTASPVLALPWRCGHRQVNVPALSFPTCFGLYLSLAL